MVDEDVCYVTDVEGNFEFFLAFVKASSALTLVKLESDGSADIELAAGWRFVHGGDACDKGGAVGGTVRVVKTLTRLKTRYPDRVHLIMGNRDINKMRLTSECAPEEIAALERIPGPYWVAPAKQVTPLMHLRAAVAARHRVAQDAVTPDMMAAANTLAARLRWMLDETYGAAGEFERRHAELTLLNGGRPPTEEETAASFVDSVKPGGFMYEYLRRGELALLHGRALYVHGGLISRFYRDGEASCLGYVPPSTPGSAPARVDGVAEWVAALNAWYGDMVQDWCSRPGWGASTVAAYEAGDRGGHALMDYVVPGSVPSVVLGRHLDAKGMPEPLPDEITRRLNASGVDRLIIGHTPHGNCPTVARSGAAPGSEPGEPSCLVVMGDTSYSDMDQADNRGAAVAEVCVGRHGKVRVRGCLHDGREFDYTLAEGNGSKHDLVGQAEAASRAGVDGRGNPQPFFVKAQLVSGEVLMCNVNGYQVTYHTMPRLLAETVLNGKGGLRETSIAAVRSSDEGAAKRGSSPMAYLFHLPLFARKLLGRREPTLGRSSGATRSSNRSSKVTVSSLDASQSDILYTSTGDDDLTGEDMATARRQMIEEAFQLTDTDGSGSLSLEEIEKGLREKHAFLKLISGTGHQTRSAEDLMKSIDTNKDRTLSMPELARFCASAPVEFRNSMRSGSPTRQLIQ